MATNEEIDELVTAPKRTTTEEGTVEERTTRELVIGDQYSATKSNVDSSPWGIRFAKTRPGNALGDG